MLKASFRLKVRIVTAKKFQNHGFQKYSSLCVFTFPQSSLMFPKPCYTNVWGGWAVWGWTLRIFLLLAPGSPEVRLVKAENRKAKFAKSHMPDSRAVDSQFAISPCSIKLADSPHASSADNSIQFLLKYLPTKISYFDKSAFRWKVDLPKNKQLASALGAVDQLIVSASADFEAWI